jgi:hypothetical protein
MLPNGLRLKSINQLGGRDRVTKACELDQDPTDSRKRLYIVDADFDFVLGTGRRRLRYFCRLNAYCIENLLIDEEAVLSAALTMQPSLDELTLRRLFRFQE